jgi:hypothetical protein
VPLTARFAGDTLYLPSDTAVQVTRVYRAVIHPRPARALTPPVSAEDTSSQRR